MPLSWPQVYFLEDPALFIGSVIKDLFLIGDNTCIHKRVIIPGTVPVHPGHRPDPVIPQSQFAIRTER